jgi:hypothetical protein
LNDDLERWINLEGPPPDDVRALLDVACGPPRVAPEHQARTDARVFAAVAEDRRRWARRRALKRALGGGLVAACLVAAILLVLRLAGPFDLRGPRGLLLRVTTEEHGDTERTAPDEAAADARPAPSGAASAGRAGGLPMRRR